MILHTFSSEDAWRRGSRHVAEGDHVLLHGDGVYCARRAAELPPHAFVLQADVAARGLADLGIATVDYAGFVELCCLADKVCSWT